MTPLETYLLISWIATPLLCLWILLKFHQVKLLLAELTKNQLAVSSGTRELCSNVESIDKDVDELWDAVFPDDDPDDEEDLDEEPTNVVAIGKHRAAA